MPTNGVYTAAPPPRHDGDRFYNPPAVRRHQRIVMQLQQMMQRQMLHQQQLQDQQQDLQLQRNGTTKGNADSSSSTEAEIPDDAPDSSTVAALPVSRSVSPASTVKFSNLDRLMESVTPFIEARYLPEMNTRGIRTPEADSHPFFYLEDLWESLSEWSVYGRGVPLLLNGRDPIKQYYVPSLSGMQLYIDTSKTSTQISGTTRGIGADLCRLTSTAGGSNCEGDMGGGESPGTPFFQYMEHESPYTRRPLGDKISLLASQCPELSMSKSCDLLPASWICVAWYPIYRIPVGPTMKDLSASFLTFHSLSTQSRSSSPPLQLHQANTRYAHGYVDPTARISLPVFALASYKLEGSIGSPCGPEECEQEKQLLQAADRWLSWLQVMLPDEKMLCSVVSCGWIHMQLKVVNRWEI